MDPIVNEESRNEPLEQTPGGNPGAARTGGQKKKAR